MEPAVGQIIDGPNGANTIQLIRKIDSGAFGVVFEAKDLSDGSTVAVKYPKTGNFTSEEIRFSLTNEIMAAKQIKHRNVVSILHWSDFSNKSAAPYLIFEYINGGTLLDILTNHRNDKSYIDHPTLLDWVHQLVDGISTINASFIHRDIKPDNILISGGVLKISDFGLAKVVDATTRIETFKGLNSIFYAAPENWLGQPSTTKMDMYSMGIVIYELATSHYPFNVPGNSADFEAFRRMHLFENPIPPSKVRPDIPIGLGQFFLRILAKNPQDRFHSWGEAIRSFDSFWNGKSEEPLAIASAKDKFIQSMTAVQEEVATRRQMEERARQNEDDIRNATEKQIGDILELLKRVVDSFNSITALDKIEFIYNANLIILSAKDRSRDPLKIAPGLWTSVSICAKVAPCHSRSLPCACPSPVSSICPAGCPT